MYAERWYADPVAYQGALSESDEDSISSGGRPKSPEPQAEAKQKWAKAMCVWDDVWPWLAWGSILSAAVAAWVVWGDVGFQVILGLCVTVLVAFWCLASAIPLGLIAILVAVAGGVLGFFTVGTAVWIAVGGILAILGGCALLCFFDIGPGLAGWE